MNWMVFWVTMDVIALVWLVVILTERRPCPRKGHYEDGAG